MSRGLALLLAALTACAPGSASEAESVGATAPVLHAGAEATAQTLVARIASAPKSVPFHGLRRLRARYEVLGEVRELELLERVASDGRGRFALAVEDLVVPSLSPAEEQIFTLIAQQRAGFAYRHRDFTIRSLGLFSQSYRIQIVGTGELLGRETLELDVRRRDAPEVHYRLVIDLQSALVLVSEERTLDGRLVSAMAFESIRFEEPPAGTAYYETPLEREELDRERPDLAAELGFELLEPSLLPHGYRPLAVDRFEGVDGRTWVRQTFSDGLEELFFLHSPREGASSAASGGGTAPGQLLVASVGPWILLEGELGPHSVIALGKLPEGSLLRVVQSAVEPALQPRGR